MIKEIKLLDIAALKFSTTSIVARLASGVAQLYAIKFFLNNLNENEYSAIILLLGYLPLFFLFDFGFSQTIQNKFNQRAIKLNNAIKILIFHFIALLAVSIFIANTEFLPRLLLSGSLLSENNIQNFSIGAALLILMSNSIVLKRVLILLGRANLFSALILIQSIFQVLGLYIYSQEVNVTQLFSIILYIGPGLVLSLILLIILAMKLIPQRENSPVDKKSFLKNSSSFFILEAMTALLVSIDYFFLSMQNNSKEIVSYHLVTRFFYISHVIYISYLMHGAKRISKSTQKRLIQKTKTSTMLLGFLTVLGVFFLLLFLKNTGYINFISEKIEMSYLLIITGFIYFIIRVKSDINVMLLINMSKKRDAFKLYLLEIIIAIICMYYLLPLYGGPGIYISLSIAYIFGLMYFKFRKLG